jgi:N6-L-threonylcarbamoyladenine synthase
MKILSIETSCDETAAAIIFKDPKENYVEILSNVVASSLILHSKTGGIIPEIAAREQLKFIIPVIEKAIENSKLKIENLDAIAVTVGPGLIGSLLIGVETAKTLAYLWNKPIIPVNHLLGHIYANFIKTVDNNNPSTIKFPALSLLVSGAHTDLILMKKRDEITWLGGTRDDAAGECFDKCARLLGYDYPGGPKISFLAEKGNPKAFHLPRPMIGSNDLDFSFSGLKAAFMRLAREKFPITNKPVYNTSFQWNHITLETTLSKSAKQVLRDLCASLEQSIIDVLVKKTIQAAKKYNVKSVLLGGGVAANEKLKSELIVNCSELKVKFFAPTKNLCTDNAAMIGAYAAFNYKPVNLKNVTADPSLYLI